MDYLRITVSLRTNIICDRWLPLDGILLYQKCRDVYGPEQATLPGGAEIEYPTLPLERRGNGNAWYYACSWAQPQPWWVAEGQDYWNKRFDVQYSGMVDFGTRRGRVITEKGHYKAYHMPVFYYVADTIEWYCVGNRDEIEYLLSTCTHIGKKTAQGWGRVSRWCVEPWYEDWSERRDGMLTRGLPITAQNDFPVNAVLYGIRPPYYRREHQILLEMPDE